MAGGRPTSYDSKYAEEIIEFFDIEHIVTVQKQVYNKKTGEVSTIEVNEPNKLPTFERFSANIGVHRGTLRNWCEDHEEFFTAYKKCQELQKDMLMNLALLGYYNPTFSIFTAKNITDMRDRIETENMNFNAVVELTPEQRKRRIDELRKKMGDE